jgi:hypothetical protein
MTNNGQEGMNTTPVQTSPSLTQNASPWRTAEERAAGILAKKKQRRAAHRVTLKRSHAKG